MTRINVVPVKELCDEHLRAEFREITRIPSAIRKGKYSLDGMPKSYTVRTEDNPAGGVGHVKFFYDKILFLEKRYYQLVMEMQERGFSRMYGWVDHCCPKELYNDYQPTPEAIELNRKRIKERTPKICHYKRERVNNEI
jgi:deoxyribonuclease (pyrimidine dimer)